MPKSGLHVLRMSPYACMYVCVYCVFCAEEWLACAVDVAVCLYVCVCVCLCLLCAEEWLACAVDVAVRLYVYVCVCCTCLHVYMYTYTHTHTYMHTDTHKQCTRTRPHTTTHLQSYCRSGHRNFRGKNFTFRPFIRKPELSYQSTGPAAYNLTSVPARAIECRAHGHR